MAKWGGKRKNAGRHKNPNKKKLMTISIEPELLAQLQDRQNDDLSFSEHISRLLELSLKIVYK